MKKLIIEITVFISIFVLGVTLFIHITSGFIKSKDFNIYNTDSNTLSMKEDQHYDMILTGASHARNLSRHKNHLRMEKILGKSITNIGQGIASCGVEDQFFYLKYFYSKGNSVDQLVYILSPPLLYSETLPYASNTFNKEYLNYNFIKQYFGFNTVNKKQRLFEYFRSKLSWEWLSYKPHTIESMDKVLDYVDEEAVEEGVLMYYGEEPSEERFKKSCDYIEKEVKYALEKGTNTVFIIPPAVFGKWPGHQETYLFASEMHVEYGCQIFDFSESILEPEFYYDHHHLNTAGVEVFVKLLNDELVDL